MIRILKPTYSDVDYVQEIQRDNQKVIDRFYLSCKRYFSGCYPRLFARDSLEADVFQESFIKLWKEIRHRSLYVEEGHLFRVNAAGKVAPLLCSLQTYLVAIAKNDYRQFLRNKEQPTEDLERLATGGDVAGKDPVEELKERIVKESVDKLSESCYKIISLFYYEKKDYEEMIGLMEGYTSKDALKTRKYKCMAKLQRHIELEFARCHIKPYVHEKGTVG